MKLVMGSNGPTLHEGNQVVAPGGQIEVSEERGKVLLGLFPDLHTAVAPVPQGKLPLTPDTRGGKEDGKAKAGK